MERQSLIAVIFAGLLGLGFAFPYIDEATEGQVSSELLGIDIPGIDIGGAIGESLTDAFMGLVRIFIIPLIIAFLIWMLLGTRGGGASLLALTLITWFGLMLVGVG